jgi:hypothetical protein
MLSPAMRSVPELIVSSPAIDRSSVDLPQPDGPTRATKRPWDGEVDVLEGVKGAVVLVDAGDLDLGRHLRAPAVRPATIRAGG